MTIVERMKRFGRGILVLTGVSEEEESIRGMASRYPPLLDLYKGSHPRVWGTMPHGPLLALIKAIQPGKRVRR